MNHYYFYILRRRANLRSLAVMSFVPQSIECFSCEIIALYQKGE